MRTYLDCYACFVRQALEATRMVGLDETHQEEIVKKVLKTLIDIDPASTPPEIGGLIHRLVREQAGDEDPYLAAKEESTGEALALYPAMKQLVETSDNPFETAVRLSIAGNIIDFGIAQRPDDLWQTVERVLDQDFALNDLHALEKACKQAGWILFLADNAGETVFDRVLIEQLVTPVFYAVKGEAIINDATYQDAVDAGIDQVAEIISNGSDMPGTILSTCSPHFRERFRQAEVIIAKGQANYETLSEKGDRIFFLLQTKCPVIARDVNVPVRSIVAKRG